MKYKCSDECVTAEEEVEFEEQREYHKLVDDHLVSEVKLHTNLEKHL